MDDLSGRMVCKIAKCKLAIKEKKLAQAAERRKCIGFDICPDCGGELKRHNMFGSLLVSKCISCSKLFNYCVRG